MYSKSHIRLLERALELISEYDCVNKSLCDNYAISGKHKNTVHVDMISRQNRLLLLKLKAIELQFIRNVVKIAIYENTHLTTDIADIISEYIS